MESIVESLLSSDEPSIRYKVRTEVLGEDIHSPEITALRQEIRTSPRVAALLGSCASNGENAGNVYKKWSGAHWILSVLADLGYPPGDERLRPLVDQVCASWLSTRHVDSVKVINGRARRCASQEGNALYSMITLGFIDQRADLLAGNLLHWQWPDGGWNCDRQPNASKSSFHETWIPLRALSLYSKMRDDRTIKEAVVKAADVFLARHLFRRLRDGSIIKPRFLQLGYPSYWHYNILSGLKVMAEAGLIRDARCGEALDILESKRLPDGGFASEIVYYSTDAKQSSRYSPVKWGVKYTGKTNEWVTAEALSVLSAAGRLRPFAEDNKH